MEDDYVKCSSSKYVLLKTDYVVSKMFSIQTDVPEDALFYDLHAISHENTVIITHGNDQEMGKYFIIGEFESSNKLKGCVIIVSRSYDIMTRQWSVVSKWSVQLVIFTNKSTRTKINRNKKPHGYTIDVDGSSDFLKLLIYDTISIISPGTLGRKEEGTTAQIWNEEIVGKRPILKDGIDLLKRQKRKHVAIISSDCASKVVDYGTLETITYIEPNTTDVKRIKSLKSEATTLSYSEISSSKESSKKTSNLREEAVSLIEGAFTQNWSPEDFVLGFKNLKAKGLEQNQLAATSAKMLMDSSYRIVDSTPIEEDVIEDVSIDVDQVSRKYNDIFNL